MATTNPVDLVEKYTLGKGNSNVIHGISKKYQRAAQTLKQATGTISYTPDPEFAKVHEKYLEITQTIPKLEKSIRDYLKVEKEILQTNRNLGFFYQQLSTETSAGLNIQDEYLNGIFDITAKQYKNLVINIENLFEILKTLMELTKGPNLILKKHQSKELDHSRYIESDGLDLDLKLSSDDFLGLNAQLLEELPVFSRLLKEVVGVFVRGFLEVRQNYVLELKGFLGDVLKNDFESFGLKMDMGGSVEQSARGIELIKDWRCSIWGGLDLNDFELVGTEDGVSTGVSISDFVGDLGSVDTGYQGGDNDSSKDAQVECLFDFEPGYDDELLLKKGDQVLLIPNDAMEGTEWMYGESSRGRGIFPRTYVRILNK
jgi:hypothetical protein